MQVWNDADLHSLRIHATPICRKPPYSEQGMHKDITFRKQPRFPRKSFNFQLLNSHVQFQHWQPVGDELLMNTEI